MRKTWVILISVTILVLMALVGCGALPAKSTAASPTASLTTVRVLDRPFISYAPFYIADANGYFAEQGIKLEHVKVSSDVEAVTATLQGSIDVAGEFLTANLMNGLAGTQDARIVADKGFLSSTGCTGNALVASKKLMDAGLAGPADLAGLRVAMAPTTIEGYLVDGYLAGANLSLDDIQMIEIPTPSELQALGDGSLDMVAASEPWITRMQDAGYGEPWLAWQDLYPDFQFSVVIYSQKLLEDRDLGTRFMVAYLKGVRQYNLGATDANVKLIADFSGLEPDLIKSSCWPTFRQDGHINLESIQKYQAWAESKGQIDTPASAEQLWDPSFIEAAGANLGSN